MEVKICGITNTDDATASLECGADALGFIFHAPSPRFVSPEQAREIIGRLPAGRVCKAGVFVNLSREVIIDIASYVGLDLIQLHGDESPEFCKGFPESVLIKAVSPQTAEDLEKIKEYAVRAILTDARDRGLYGGTGKVCDWDTAAAIARERVLILSGGLGPDNLQEAIRRVAPAAVDLNSGIECEPGKKDHAKMRKAVEIARKVKAAPQYSIFSCRGGSETRPHFHTDSNGRV